MTEPILQVEGLRVAFGDAEPVVRDVSFDLTPGRVLALVGESGSGKSVSAMSVLGLLPPQVSVSGSARFRGEELIGAPVETVRAVRGAGIGVVFQEPMNSFTPVLSIGTQIAEAVRAHPTGLDRAGVRARVDELLRDAGLTDPERIRKAYPHELSGGQLQRAMIAMALAGDPVALFADEPTTALDVTVQAGILDLLRRLGRERSLAVLLITHDMGVVADVADDLLVLRRGDPVEHGTVAEVFAHPTADYTRELLAAVPSLEAASATPAADPDARVGEPGSRAHRQLTAPGAREVSPSAKTAAVRDEADASRASRPPVARLRDVAVRYSRRGGPTVSGIDLDLHAGETVGLVGESGSGKSTIGRALAGLVPVVAGSVEVDGSDLRTARGRRLRELRSRVGIVFQDPASSLNPRQTIGWSIAEPLLVHGTDSAAERAERVRELLTAVQLDPTWAERFPHQLSGGQRQRVAVARALALRPALVIADEPTSALDVTVQAAVLDLLAGLQREFGFGMLLISHDLAVVRQLADQVIVLRDGRVVERGSTDAVLDDPHQDYTRMLLAAAPVADPVRQAARREAWRAWEGVAS
ncbi:dipeptide ABC transporter ATP-binding protein [Curtobacterium flaccumfaciens]|uniref:dipeptide ABC transporter ATP-binding protein n=1 Tax=Curtobacterium flaccumfaciens TaxID=2035 RepID=UPI001BDEBE5F|nr:ABC transporter ATP-binding protein [Curtobacterium flaccumfaciens]MBT1608594.1 ABC transporter ATP-binding protein [Curtobacterium flaccumfaciens pv. betae]MBT1658512.1 ABC transporter ATP-binding protein [Curtobacterium flaccumfaciens pv. betae]MCS0471781.1 ABC transporter ATP-binding protein [Curtobacterium flaccumfaciens pv. betae]MCS0475147.1 ABC transporter ATP-binding protein [Curtobacterium flaccumfaciens pv. betae]MCS0478194.1 ABC transporter ATP-binding protein [Curtobacterium fla